MQATLSLYLFVSALLMNHSQASSMRVPRATVQLTASWQRSASPFLCELFWLLRLHASNAMLLPIGKTSGKRASKGSLLTQRCIRQ